MIWVICIDNVLTEQILISATLLGLFLQVLSTRLGIVTEKDLATVCRDEYGSKTPLTITIWLITEVESLFHLLKFFLSQQL